MWQDSLSGTCCVAVKYSPNVTYLLISSMHLPLLVAHSIQWQLQERLGCVTPGFCASSNRLASGKSNSIWKTIHYSSLPLIACESVTQACGGSCPFRIAEFPWKLEGRA
jgi:hypothetical protein